MFASRHSRALALSCLAWAGTAASLPSAESPGPAPRSSDQMVAYDSRSERVQVFGGSGQDRSHGDLWSWDGRSWELLAADGPPPRDAGVMAYDSLRQRTVLFGGRSKEGVLGDTWEWDGTRWQRLDADGPAPRLHGVAAFDPGKKEVVLFGPLFGATHMPRPLPSETWTWDGRSWARVDAGGPSDCIPVGMAFDEGRQALALLSTRLAAASSDAPWGATELWYWTGNAWRLEPVSLPPFTPSQSSLAPARDGLLLYEASNPTGTSGVTWRWDGKTWRELNRGGGPSPRQGSHVMAFDRARQRHVLFGGVQLLNGGRERRRLGDLWEWDGRRWSRAHPPPA